MAASETHPSPQQEIMVIDLPHIDDPQHRLWIDHQLTGLNQVGRDAQLHRHHVGSAAGDNRKWDPAADQAAGNLHHCAVAAVHSNHIHPGPGRLLCITASVTRIFGDEYIPVHAGCLKRGIQHLQDGLVFASSRVDDHMHPPRLIPWLETASQEGFHPGKDILWLLISILLYLGFHHASPQSPWNFEI
jgi:hypothetical protein